MLEQFRNFIDKEKLAAPLIGNEKEAPRFLLAVSGGVDSVVMCDLFYKANLPFGIAHCNFHLRGKESDADEKFVRRLAEKYKVPFYKKSFRTESFARRTKLSVQMAARELRYDWLKRLAKEKKYGFIATAHHVDDSIETFFINLLRGTGIAGLQGIPVKQGNIIRPLLFANKKMIRDYAEENKLEWREDSSNRTDKYLRNSIRHHLIPSLKKLNKGFEKTITKELSYFKEAGAIFKKFIEEKKKEIMEEDGKNILLNIKKLKDSGHVETLLHEILRAYDFTPETTELIAQRLYTTAGRKFFSPTYRLIKDRDFLILTPKKHRPIWQTGTHPSQKKITEASAKQPFLLKKNQIELHAEGIHLKREIIEGSISAVADKSPSTAHLDLDKLVFPLTLRKWKPGDFFYPLGMKGRKKLSDFFTDLKLPVNKKEETYVLLSDGNIAWVVGYRMDDRFKVTERTSRIYKLKVESV